MKYMTTATTCIVTPTACVLTALLSVLSVSSRAGENESPATPAPQLRVVGTLTDADGNALPDAIASVVYWETGPRTRVISQTTDKEGRYDMRLPSTPSSAITVAGWKAGYALGVANSTPSFDGRLSTSVAIELPMTLVSCKPLTLHVVDAEGTSVKGGRIGIIALGFVDGPAAFYWQRTELDLLSRKIDANGQVTFDYLPEDSGATMLIEVPGGGIQAFSVVRNRVSDGATVKLLPVGTINVALVSNDPRNIQDRELVIQSRPQQRPRVTPDQPASVITTTHSVATVTTDDAGRATAIVSAGNVTTEVSRRPNARVFPEAMEPVTLAPGGVADVEIAFEPGVTVRGRVLTDHDQPVAGVEVAIADARATTGEDGWFEALLPASQWPYGRVVDVPPGFAWPFSTSLKVPRGNDSGAKKAGSRGELVATTIRCGKAVLFAGVVADEAGEPVPLADVDAAWVQKDETDRYYTLKSESVQTDSKGRFQFRHILSGVDVRVTAQTDRVATMAAAVIHADRAKQLQLQVTPAGMVRIVGTVKGSDGAAIANADVKVARALVSPAGSDYGTRPVQWHGSKTFPSDAQGQFTSPRSVPRFGKYSLTFSAPGYMAVETPFLSPPDSGSALELGEVELTKARVAAGTVRDSAGNPLPGASVWAYTVPTGVGRTAAERSRVETDETGRFTLEQLHPKAAIAIVKKDGYRISGGPLLIGQPEMDITLLRRDEPVPVEHAVRPRSFDKAERHAAARKLLEAILPERGGSAYFSEEAITMLAKSDPAAALAEVEKSRSASVRAKALAILGEIPDAMAEAEAIDDPYRRTFARYAILDQIRDPDASRDALATTLLDAQSIRRPDQRIVVIAHVAERFAKLGDTQRAEQILRDALPQALALSTKEWPGYARASFAESFAQFDPDAALKIVSEADADDQKRHYRNIAQVLAAVNPEAAEVALDRIGKDLYVDAPAVRVAYRMAPVDLPRAVQLLDRIDKRRRPTEQPRGLGVIAMAIEDSNPDKARELLAQALAAIPEQGRGGSSREEGIFGASITLLRFAEEIDPDNLTEYYWRALSSYPGPDGGAWSPDNKEAKDADRQAQLALVLSLYDAMPDTPKQIMEAVFAYWEGRIGANPGRFTDREATFMAMAMTDPKRAADWAIRFDAKLDKDLRRHIPQPWEVIGNTLTNDREAIGKRITREVYHRWVIDQYD